MMLMAFENFKEIEALPDIVQKHKAWLKQYEGKIYSIALDGKHKMKWSTEKKAYIEQHYSTDINCIGRLPNRTIIEFDDDDAQKRKEHTELTKKKLKELGVGFIVSSHKGKSEYIWVEFTRAMKDKEIKQFLAWISPSGARIDLNFASSNKVFAVLFATHWKHSYQRELPIEFVEGERLNYDSLGIAPEERLKKTVSSFSFKYETFNKEAGKVYSSSGQAELFTEMQPLFYDRSGNWWLWNFKDFKWQLVDEVDILNMVHQSTGMDIITPKERTRILNSLKQEGRKIIPEQIKTSWIQFKDIFYDINTGEEKQVTPKYFATNPIPYSIPKDRFTETPNMDRIFEEWVGKEHVKTLYEIIAYCMIPDYPIHRLFCFIGAGMNGKSCYLRLLKKFIGGENVTATELDTLLNSRFEVTKLYKKLVCIMGETNFAEMSKTSIIKKLTGQDMIGFEYKNKTPFDDTNYAKILIATNNLPATSDKTIGFYRRWMIIDFPNHFSEQKDILAEIPEEEYSNLTLKCALILKDVLKNRGFTNEGSIEERQKKFEDKSDPLQKFIAMFTQEDFSSHIWKYDLEKKFNQWCKENRFREYSDVAIGKKMKELGIETQTKTASWLNDGKGGQLRAWIGLRWKL